MYVVMYTAVALTSCSYLTRHFYKEIDLKKVKPLKTSIPPNIRHIMACLGYFYIFCISISKQTYFLKADKLCTSSSYQSYYHCVLNVNRPSRKDLQVSLKSQAKKQTQCNK